MPSKPLKTLSFGTLLLQTVLSVLLVLGMHGAALAEDAPEPASSTKFNVSNYLTTEGQGQAYLKTGNPIASFIIQIVNFLVLTIGSVCFLAIVVGGFTLLTSHGNENQLSKGKDIIKLALIGLVIVLTSYFITAFVQSLFYELPPK